MARKRIKWSGYRSNLDRAPKNTLAIFLWSVFGLTDRESSFDPVRPASNWRLLQSPGSELAYRRVLTLKLRCRKIKWIEENYKGC